MLLRFRMRFWLPALALAACSAPPAQAPVLPQEPFVYTDAARPRWVSFENPAGAPGQGGQENNGAKGHPFDRLPAGSTQTLLDLQGPGIITRIWITINHRTPYMLRSLVLRMYWDGETQPAVEVPFGDFFGVGLGRTTAFENALFANPEGRSFNAFVQMPFRRSARIELVNESGMDLHMVFYDIDVQTVSRWDPAWMYFHACWRRDTATALGQDFEILPQVQGKGRFLGVNAGINAHPRYGDHWWGEGEVKLYLDGDQQLPTLIGTGTEDYIGTAWGQGAFCNRYTGCLIADPAARQWAFYRYHLPDPVYFGSGCRVTIQQIGGSMKAQVRDLQARGVPLIPVSIHSDTVKLQPLYRPGSVTQLDDPALIDGWTNYYRSDDMSAVAYFYLDRPSSGLPRLQPAAVRTWGIRRE
ncbi:MAG: glycoside hydrolase family 172 protein [Bacteroidia bacterium]|nr:glycoside hydrolase family 172 protein [Bacteroidia bacterium]